MKTTTAQQIRLDLLARAEIAILDLRGEAPYALEHPLFAASLPLGQIEQRIFAMVPRRDTRIVVYDGGEGYDAIALRRLATLGYTNVSALAGGVKAWAHAGYELFQDVNSASKAFGELVESRRHTPSIPAAEAKALIESDDNLIVLDARRFDEYHTMSIPRGISVPGAELVMRARTLAPDPSTRIIVNCAGRTRSIIGAQSLINAGVPNEVMALRNGTIGWLLAGQQLDHGREERYPETSGIEHEQFREPTRAVAYRAGVKRLDPAQFHELKADPARTTYFFDVRSPEEFAHGHIAGSRSAPGGQLVQETDAFAPVRGARIILADDIGPRANMTASWLAQMGWEVYVLDGGFDGPLERGTPPPDRPAPPAIPTVTALELKTLIAGGSAAVVDVSASPRYRQAHIPGAAFATRSRLPEAAARLSGHRNIVITSEDGYLARFAALELATLIATPVHALEGGNVAWRECGFSTESGSESYLSEPDDVYRRPYEGADNPAHAMQAYLDWEFGLVAQLERDATHGFFVI